MQAIVKSERFNPMAYLVALGAGGIGRLRPDERNEIIQNFVTGANRVLEREGFRQRNFVVSRKEAVRFAAGGYAIRPLESYEQGRLGVGRFELTLLNRPNTDVVVRSNRVDVSWRVPEKVVKAEEVPKVAPMIRRYLDPYFVYPVDGKIAGSDIKTVMGIAGLVVRGRMEEAVDMVRKSEKVYATGVKGVAGGIARESLSLLLL